MNERVKKSSVDVKIKKGKLNETVCLHISHKYLLTEKSNSTVQKSDRHNLNQVIKANVTSKKTNLHHGPPDTMH